MPQQERRSAPILSQDYIIILQVLPSQETTSLLRIILLRIVHQAELLANTTPPQERRSTPILSQDYLILQALPSRETTSLLRIHQAELLANTTPPQGPR